MTPNAEQTGFIQIEGDMENGSSVTFSVTPDEGYHFIDMTTPETKERFRKATFRKLKTALNTPEGVSWRMK
jgi:hypothetical protein